MATLGAVLDERLNRGGAAPLLIGLSGGGDSLALLLLAQDWARASGRRLVAATVDHRLRPEGGVWADWCAARCAALGAPHITLTWTAPKPAVGLHAAARSARHRLLADAARREGADVILLAHTADDVLEAAWMRQNGARTAAPKPWSPSPVWPEGRGLFLLRPLLGVRRSALRDLLSARGEAWIEDPANRDPDSLRARARQALTGTGFAFPTPVREASPGLPPLAEGPGGALFGARDPLLAKGPTVARFWVGTAVTCVGGGEAPASPRGLDAVMARLERGAPFGVTLAGARMICDGRSVLMVREAGDRRVGRSAPLALSAGESVVWDGRFLAAPGDPRWSVAHLKGRMAKLERAQRRALKAIHPAARGAIPALLGPAQEVVCPTLGPSEPGQLRSLIAQRLAARCGAIQHESDIATWRNACKHPKSP